MQIKPVIGLAVQVQPFEVGADRGPEILKKAEKILKKLPIKLAVAPQVVQDDVSLQTAIKKFKKADIDIICWVLGTWSEDHWVLDLLEEFDLPLVTWALPGVNTGSLCGCQQICSVLYNIEKTYRFIYGELTAEKPLNELLVYARAACLRRFLRKVRIGLVGYRVPGMTEVAFDEFELKALFGPRVIHLGIEKLLSDMDKIEKKQYKELWSKLKKKVGKVEVKEEDGLRSLSAYLALKQFCTKNQLSALAVECYPDLMGQVCLAASLLGSEGIPVACEGDVNSALAMLILSRLNGEAIHNTDLLAVDENDDTMIMSHCGSGGFELANQLKEITFASVRLANKGLCVLFTGHPGEVTMLNIVGNRGTYRMSAIPGEALPVEMVFPGNPIKVQIPIKIRTFLDTVADNGLGHHWMVGYGNYLPELNELAKMINIPCICLH